MLISFTDSFLAVHVEIPSIQYVDKISSVVHVILHSPLSVSMHQRLEIPHGRRIVQVDVRQVLAVESQPLTPRALGAERH